MEGARDMIQVTERAREAFKNRLENRIERPNVMLRIGHTDSGLGFFPDTLKDDDQIIEHDGRAVLLIDQEVSETLADTTIDVEERADGAHFVVRRSRTTRPHASHEG
jgi:Fe-S cluster assembly iron-binding protein IscA